MCNFFDEVNTMNFKNDKSTIFDYSKVACDENLISNLFAFFADSRKEHGFGTLLIESIFECIKEKCSSTIPINFEIKRDPIRELYTDENNRIDLNFIGNDWILTIENKLFSNANNDFGNYKNFVEKKYTDKKLYFVILAPYELKITDWISITYIDLLRNIKKRFNYDLTTRWNVLFNEFILCIENKINNLSIDAFDYITENYHKFTKVRYMLDDYYNCIRSLINTKLFGLIDETKNIINHWKYVNITAIRYTIPDTDFNISFLIKDDGTYSVQFYVYNYKNYYMDKINSTLNQNNKYIPHYENKKTTKCFVPKNYYSLNEALEEYYKIFLLLVKIKKEISTYKI